MADNRYQYNYNYSGGSENGRGGGNGMNDLPYWITALIFLFVFPPVGVLMLAIRLFGGGKKRGRHPYYEQRDGYAPTAAQASSLRQEQTPRQEQAVRQENRRQAADPQEAKQQSKQMKRIRKLQSKLAERGKGLVTAGAIITGIFTFSSIVTAMDSMWMLPNLAWFLEDLVPQLCFVAGGAAMLWTGLRQRKEARRYRKYLSLIGKRESISIEALASAMPASASRVRRDLEDMLDDGWFPAGYLDYGGDRLVLTDDGLADQPEPVKQEPEKVEKAAPADEENAVLAEIRAVNDAIEDETLSAQIDRIGVITAKIFDYQKSHPDKSAQLHAFLSYYLPTTLKILRAYAQLESQGVEGQNINAAMTRIEGMMEKVVEGFEKQLDQLFQGDAMDITTDVAVLEQMLSKDGLSSGGMQMQI